MEQIRLIEADILVYQETLRTRASKQELDEYELQGQEKLAAFNKMWQEKFQKFQDEKQLKMTNLDRYHALETHDLNEELQRDIEFVKVKPKTSMRAL